MLIIGYGLHRLEFVTLLFLQKKQPGINLGAESRSTEILRSFPPADVTRELPFAKHHYLHDDWPRRVTVALNDDASRN